MTTEMTTQSGAHKRKNYKDDAEKPVIAKTATDLQRLRLEKLMKQPDKPVPIPERPKEKSMPHVPDFVRNVMGSSAGAGSGEFHVYRHLRRKEYARQKFIQEKAEKELRDEEYHMKLEENRRLAEERTAKKRAKRLKKKQKQNKKFKPVTNMVKHSGKDISSDSESESENASEESEKSSFVQTEVKTERKRESDEEKTLCNIEKADTLQGESKSSKHKKNEPEDNDNESKESSEGSDSEG